MILNNTIRIRVNSMDVKRLYEINNKYNLHVGDIIDICVSELSNNSKRKIKVKCDICETEKELTYSKYIKNIKNCNFYACSSKCANKKVINTSLIRFGVTNASKSIEKKDKRASTNMKKFGVINAFQNDNIINKLKETNIKKYGVDNIFKSEEFKIYIKKYNIENYGVEYISQVPELYMRQQKSGYRIHHHEKTNLYYRGTYEKHFLDYCFENNIQISQGKRIKYTFENKDHYYFSDFFIEEKNLIVEIKSSWTYNKYINKNIAKQLATIKLGYNYLFVVDKNYDEFITF